jgi:hypothetical protein
MRDSPIAGRDDPGSLPELRSWFLSDGDCLDYLDWLRWPEGFACPWCAGVGEWSTAPGLHRCSDCSRRISVTSGTIFHRTRVPLTVWIEAAWLMLSKQGSSVQTRQRTTGLGSCPTAWTMLHKFRTAMDPSGHQQLSGQVEVDETFIGGKKTVLKGRGAAGKMLVAGAVARKGSGLGRTRPQIIPDATTPILTGFLRTTVALGPMVIAYGWTAYPPACKAVGLMHTTHKVTSSGQPAHVYLPGCTGYSPWQGECSEEPTKAAFNPNTFSPIWTSSYSGSTVADRPNGACCSSDSLKPPHPVSWCPTTTSHASGTNRCELPPRLQRPTTNRAR